MILQFMFKLVTNSNFVIPAYPINRFPFIKFTLSSFKHLQTIFSELQGSSPVLSIDKKLYYYLFIDQHTKYMWIYTLQYKRCFSEISSKYFNFKILSFYTNSGGEFQSLDSYLNSQGIEHLLAPSCIPQSSYNYLLPYYIFN